jgi:hypothetical protein
MDEPKNTTRFGPGNPGKPKGATNHLTREIKQMVSEALEQAGGVDYLAAKAESHPAAFLALVGRVIPLQVSGDPDNPLAIGLKVEFVNPPVPRSA